MKKTSKKALLHKTTSAITSLLTNRKTIVFDAQNLFHLAHFNPVIKLLAKHHQKKINIIITCPEQLTPQYSCFKHFDNIYELPIWRKVDLVIKSEFNPIPYWLSTTTIFFGHGIGPKLSYQTPKLLTLFDYIFSACLPIYNVQSAIFNPDKMYKVGLPILDKLQVDSNKIQSHFSLDNDKPTIIYAPSWCSYPEYITDIDKALNKLNEIHDVNVIVSPHPNLLKKERCDGKDHFSNHKQYKNLFYNFSGSPFTTLDLCNYSDITISDISSVLFESMALGKVTLFEDSYEIFKKFEAEEVYQQLIKCCYVINWDNTEVKDITKNLESDPYAALREQFINNYIFNRGNATEVFINTTLQLLSLTPLK